MLESNVTLGAGRKLGHTYKTYTDILFSLCSEWKNTLKTEREAFAVKLKRQSRKIQDLEIKTKFQQNEVCNTSNTNNLIILETEVNPLHKAI